MESDSQIIPHPKGRPIAANGEIRVYKKTPQEDLELHVLAPEQKGVLPAVVFFFGGDWKSGKVTQFLRHGLHFNRRGMVSILVDYRVECRQGTNPVHAVHDARSALRYLKSHAEELSINPHKMVVAGEGAGAHLALCTALANEMNDPQDDLSVDPAPVAVIGFGAVCDTSAQGFGFDQFPVGAALLASPYHLVESLAPPVLLMHGTEDQVVPLQQAKAFRQKMHQAGATCELIEYAGRGHGFSKDGADFFSTLTEMDLFLVNHELLAPLA